ncbi:MAG: PmeII family type II restriction endonuclease [Nitrospira sp.]
MANKIEGNIEAGQSKNRLCSGGATIGCTIMLSYNLAERTTSFHWGNSGQIREMKANFLKAQRVLRTSRTNLHVVALNGCCYGKDDRPEKEGYLKLCGQRFWTFLSGDESLYTDIIEPLGHRARERNEAFLEAYAGIINRFTQEFASEFCDQDGRIAWERLVELTSRMHQVEPAAT